MIGVGIIGFGTVGSGTYKILTESQVPHKGKNGPGYKSCQDRRGGPEKNKGERDTGRHSYKRAPKNS